MARPRPGPRRDPSLHLISNERAAETAARIEQNDQKVLLHRLGVTLLRRFGTAGSATLVLQTVLPALLLAKDESNLTLEGGTHNPFAPPVDFLERAYLPLVNRLGPQVEVQLVRPG